ncbi:MAG: carboxypeptidase-like regulatory domain-containing protein, partial [Blastocatellia bacterium]
MPHLMTNFMQVTGWVTRLVVMVTLMTMIAPGQSATGSLSGQVTDPSGAVIPGAKVTVTSANTGATRATTTDAEGRWKVPVLDIGAYTIGIEAQGFKKGNVENVTVEAAVPRQLEIQLQAGQVSDTVTITTSTEIV